MVENFVIYDGVKFELGTLEDFSDEELANPDELERQAIKAKLEPVLLLPIKNKKRNFSTWDCSEEIGFDAFGTVDFDRYRPKLDKARYKVQKLTASPFPGKRKQTKDKNIYDQNAGNNRKDRI